MGLFKTVDDKFKEIGFSYRLFFFTYTFTKFRAYNGYMATIILTGGGTAGHVTPNIALFPFLEKAKSKQQKYGNMTVILSMLSGCMIFIMVI